MSDVVDNLIHQPTRFLIMSHMYNLIEADVLFLKRKIEERGKITWGNLSTHMTKLEEAGYLEVEKSIVDKKTRTVLRITSVGKQAYDEYRKTMLSLLTKNNKK